MICTICQEASQVSTITLPLNFSLVGVLTSFNDEYDESGNQHRHDPNIYTRVGSCSEGHTVTVTMTNVCSQGDYGNDESVAFS